MIRLQKLIFCRQMQTMTELFFDRSFDLKKNKQTIVLTHHPPQFPAASYCVIKSLLLVQPAVDLKSRTKESEAARTLRGVGVFSTLIKSVDTNNK